MKLTPDQLRQSAAAMLALADGNPIEFQGRDGTWYPSGDIDCDYPHRPKPAWKLPPPPAGKRWHRDDFTEEMLPIIDGKQTRPLLDGEKMQPEDEKHMGEVGWQLFGAESKYGSMSYNSHHRTTRDLPAEPVARPWNCAADVPCPCYIRAAESEGLSWAAVTSAGTAQITAIGDDGIQRIAYGSLKYYHYSTTRADGSWKSCTTEAP